MSVELRPRTLPSSQAVVAPAVSLPRLAPSTRPAWHLAVDKLLAATLLIFLLPVLIVVALAVRASSSGPILFRQRRVGLDGVRFDILKFRTMCVSASPEAFTLAPGQAPGGIEGADRRTAVGALLRRTSLDELPQLLNVLRGDMALVGPRPERPEFVELFCDEVPGYVDRHRVRPGITGLAQVRGLRGQTSIAARTHADREYIVGRSLRLDLLILLRTLVAAFRSPELAR